jgi:hypothetical protein
MGSRIHPETAPGDWLDYVARWLGLPWDDALTLDQKRRIVMHAAMIAKARGTRAGLETLLACLIPPEPEGLRRFRVGDGTADYGIATLGGGRCRGSRLPTVLAGFSAPAAELGTRLVLGSARLPCEGDKDDDSMYLVGRVRVDVAATAEERRDWSPWFKALIMEVMPISASLTLRWLPPSALGSIEGDITLAGDPVPQLGTDTIMGATRLPGRESALSESGTAIGGRIH